MVKTEIHVCRCMHMSPALSRAASWVSDSDPDHERKSEMSPAATMWKSEVVTPWEFDEKRNVAMGDKSGM